MKPKCFFLFMILVVAFNSTYANILITPESDFIEDHYEAFRKTLPAESQEELLTYSALLNGPLELVNLLNKDEKLQKSALDALWMNGGYEETYIKYGERILPYITYVLSDIKNKNSKIALSLLFEVSRALTLKSRRGPFAMVDEEALKEYVDKIPQNLPELSSYPPLKSILLHSLSSSSNRKVRSSSAWTLVQAYDADLELEESLGKQFRDKQSGNIDMDIMASIAHMAMSEAYNNGFLSPETMGLMIEAMDDDNISNFHYAALFIGKYKPQIALPKLMNIIKNEEGYEFLAALIAMGQYGPEASEFIPQLQAKYDSETDDSRREQLASVIGKLNP